MALSKRQPMVMYRDSLLLKSRVKPDAVHKSRFGFHVT